MEYHKISSQILRDHQDDLMWEYQGSGAGVEVTTYSSWATPDTPCFIIYTVMGLSLPLKLDNYLLCSRGDTALPRCSRYSLLQAQL